MARYRTFQLSVVPAVRVRGLPLLHALELRVGPGEPRRRDEEALVSGGLAGAEARQHAAKDEAVPGPEIRNPDDVEA